MTKQLSTSEGTSGSDLRKARTAAQLYARVHLKELAGDLVSLSEGTLAADSRLEALTQLCSKIGSGQARNCAVSMVNKELRDHMLAQPGKLDVDELAQEIRRVDGNHSLGAGALAEALMPFLASHTTVRPGASGDAKDRRIVELEDVMQSVEQMIEELGENVPVSHIKVIRYVKDACAGIPFAAPGAQ